MFFELCYNIDWIFAIARIIFLILVIAYIQKSLKMFLLPEGMGFSVARSDFFSGVKALFPDNEGTVKAVWHLQSFLNFCYYCQFFLFFFLLPAALIIHQIRLTPQII